MNPCLTVFRSRSFRFLLLPLPHHTSQLLPIATLMLDPKAPHPAPGIILDFHRRVGQTHHTLSEEINTMPHVRHRLLLHHLRLFPFLCIRPLLCVRPPRRRVQVIEVASDPVLVLFVGFFTPSKKENEGDIKTYARKKKRKKAYQTVQLMINRQCGPLRRKARMSKKSPLRGKELCPGAVREVRRRRGKGAVVGKSHLGWFY